MNSQLANINILYIARIKSQYSYPSSAILRLIQEIVHEHPNKMDVK